MSWNLPVPSVTTLRLHLFFLVYPNPLSPSLSVCVCVSLSPTLSLRVPLFSLSFSTFSPPPTTSSLCLFSRFPLLSSRPSFPSLPRSIFRMDGSGGSGTREGPPGVRDPGRGTPGSRTPVRPCHRSGRTGCPHTERKVNRRKKLTFPRTHTSKSPRKRLGNVRFEVNPFFFGLTERKLTCSALVRGLSRV